MRNEGVPGWKTIAAEWCPQAFEVEKELRLMRQEMRAAEQEAYSPLAVIWKKWHEGGLRRAMEYLVDAGAIERVQGKSDRDAAQLALTSLGDRAQFPIDVYSIATGEKTTFLLEECAPGESPMPPKKEPSTAEAPRVKRARA